MLRLWLLSLLSGVLWMQLVLPTSAVEIAEVINNDIRNRLRIYDEFSAQEGFAPYKDDLSKLIKLTESALASDNVEQKRTALNGIGNNLAPEFNKYLAEKLEELDVNGDILQAIDFYRSLMDTKPQYKDELEAIITKLQNLRQTFDLKAKEVGLLSVEKTLSPELQSIIREKSLVRLTLELQKHLDFLKAVLRDQNNKYESEIKALIEQIQVALGGVSEEEKLNTLQKVTNPESRELYEYLQKKFMEMN